MMVPASVPLLLNTVTTGLSPGPLPTAKSCGVVKFTTLNRAIRGTVAPKFEARKSRFEGSTTIVAAAWLFNRLVSIRPPWIGGKLTETVLAIKPDAVAETVAVTVSVTLWPAARFRPDQTPVA